MRFHPYSVNVDDQKGAGVARGTKPKRGELNVEQAIASRTNRNPCHELLLGAISKWEADHGGAPAAVLMHPLTLSTLEAEPKAREWKHTERFYGLAVLVRTYEGIPYQLLSEEEARAFG
jgi:hypothetical protein